MKRDEIHFPGWYERGWVQPKIGSDTRWDGVTYNIMTLPAIWHSIERAGLQGVTREVIMVDGNPDLGHSSNTQGARGIVANGRDLYLVHKPEAA